MQQFRDGVMCRGLTITFFVRFFNKYYLATFPKSRIEFVRCSNIKYREELTDGHESWKRWCIKANSKDHEHQEENGGRDKNDCPKIAQFQASPPEHSTHLWYCRIAQMPLLLSGDIEPCFWKWTQNHHTVWQHGVMPSACKKSSVTFTVAPWDISDLMCSLAHMESRGSF